MSECEEETIKLEKLLKVEVDDTNQVRQSDKFGALPNERQIARVCGKQAAR